MFVLELRVLPVLRRSPEGSGVPMDFADELEADAVEDWIMVGGVIIHWVD